MSHDPVILTLSGFLTDGSKGHPIGLSSGIPGAQIQPQQIFPLRVMLKTFWYVHKIQNLGNLTQIAAAFASVTPYILQLIWINVCRSGHNQNIKKKKKNFIDTSMKLNQNVVI